MFPSKGRFVAHALAMLALSLLVWPRISLSSELAPAEVVRAAKTGLQPFLRAIPSDEIAHYGFSSEAEFAEASLGEPFRVYTIMPDEIFAYRRGANLLSLLTPTTLWHFPIVCRGQTRTILTVDLMKGRWQAVAIGQSGVAVEVQKIRSKWPGAEGYQHTFLRIFQAQSDFLVISKGLELKLAPLSSAALALELEARPDGLYEPLDPAEVIPKLAPIVEENLQMLGTP